MCDALSNVCLQPFALKLAHTAKLGDNSNMFRDIKSFAKLYKDEFIPNE